MLVLINQPLIPISLGCLLIIWGLIDLRLNFTEWVQLIIKLIFNNFSDQTKGEKRAIKSEPADEFMANNAGCILIIFGLMSLGFGFIRLLSGLR